MINNKTLEELEKDVLEIQKQAYDIENTMRELNDIKGHLFIISNKTLEKIRFLLKENFKNDKDKKFCKDLGKVI